jgi:hypothetical protein
MEVLLAMAYTGAVEDDGPCVAQALAGFLLFVLNDEKSQTGQISNADFERLAVADPLNDSDEEANDGDIDDDEACDGGNDVTNDGDEKL